jgi:hypothetical protein
MNSRSAVSATQRAGQKKRQGKRAIDQISSDGDNTSEVIDVEKHLGQRRRTEGSPSVRAILRSGRWSGGARGVNGRQGARRQ